MRNDFPSQIDARWSLCQCRCRSSNEALLSSVWGPMFASLQILIFSEQIRWQSLWQQNDWMCGLFSGISSFFSSLFIRLFVLSYSIVFLFWRLWRSLGITMEASHVTRAGLSSGFSSSILAYLRSFGHPKCKTVRVKSQHVRMEVRFHITTPNIRRTSQRADRPVCKESGSCPMKQVFVSDDDADDESGSCRFA